MYLGGKFVIFSIIPLKRIEQSVYMLSLFQPNNNLKSLISHKDKQGNEESKMCQHNNNNNSNNNDYNVYLQSRETQYFRNSKKIEIHALQ